MNSLQLLKNHYEGKTIIGGDLHPQYKGWQIVLVALNSYESMLEFAIKNGHQVDSISVLFEWNIEVA